MRVVARIDQKGETTPLVELLTSPQLIPLPVGDYTVTIEARDARGHLTRCTPVETTVASDARVNIVMPASAGSLQAAKESKLDLGGHRSLGLTTELIRDSDRIYCMSPSHVHDVLDRDPGAADKTFLLDPNDAAVSDPFGGRVDVYRATRDEIEAHLRARMDEILALGA